MTFAIAASPQSVQPHAQSMLTRSQLLSLGQNDSPWRFIPLGLAAIAEHPEDHELRFMLAAAYGRLALKTSAIEHLAMLPAALAADPQVAGLRVAIEALPDDRVPARTSIASCQRNLDALAARGALPSAVQARLNAWRLEAGRREVFAARNGDIVVRAKADPSVWLHWPCGDLVGEMRFAHEQRGSAAPAFVVEGMNAPLLRRAVEATRPSGNGYRASITILQQSVDDFLTAMGTGDVADLLADDRIDVRVGGESVAAWVSQLRERAARGFAIHAMCLVSPSIEVCRSERVEIPAGQLISQESERQGRAFVETSASNAARFGSVDVQKIAARFDAALRGVDRPLRVLVPTSRFSTFIKHAAADLAHALTELGCDARMLMEPDDHTDLTNLAWAKTIEATSPDLIVQANFTRSNTNNIAPPGIVHVTWVQDAMTHLFDTNVGASQGPTDFTVGCLREEMFTKWGYPSERAMPVPMLASERKFHPGVVTDAQRAKFACEIAYVSHHGQTPEAFHAAKIAEARLGGDDRRWLIAFAEAVFASVKTIVDAGALDPITWRLNEITAGAIADAGMMPSDAIVSRLFNEYTHPLLDRMLRHQTLAWAARLADERGWRMKIFGRGWASHPTLARFANDPIEHGDDLRAAYTLARTHMQLSGHTVAHQRVFECALSGGLAVARLQGDDILTTEFQCAAEAVLTGAQVAEVDPSRKAQPGSQWHALDAASHAELRAFNGLLRSVGLPERARIWFNPARMDEVRAEGSYPGRGFSIPTLLGGIDNCAQVMFADEASFRRVVTRAVEDDRWRGARIDAMRAMALEHATYSGFAKKLLGFVRDGLARQTQP